MPTIEETLFSILENPTWSWAAQWFTGGETLVSTLERTYAEKRDIGAVQTPRNLKALGSSGTDHLGRLVWVGFDLDVGHGLVSYATTDIAILAARKLKAYLGEPCEIRRSRGGLGIHVRKYIGPDAGIQGTEGPRMAKDAVLKLGLRADMASLGRQVHFLWDAKPGPRGFEIVEAPDNGA